MKLKIIKGKVYDNKYVSLAWKNISIIPNNHYYTGQLIEYDNKLYIIDNMYSNNDAYVRIIALDMIDVFESDVLHELDEFYRKDMDGFYTVYRYIRKQN